MTLGELLKNSRKTAKLTLKKAALNVDISLGYLHDLESGRALRPKMKVLRAISDFYPIDYDMLCLTAERLPQDCFYKIIRCPELLEVIRNHSER